MKVKLERDSKYAVREDRMIGVPSSALRGTCALLVGVVAAYMYTSANIPHFRQLCCQAYMIPRGATITDFRFMLHGQHLRTSHGSSILAEAVFLGAAPPAHKIDLT